MQNQPTSVTAPTTVNFSTPAIGAGFFSNPSCSLSTTTATIATGARTATVYFRAAQAGSPVLTAASAGLAPATQVLTVLAPPTSLAFVNGAPTTPTAGLCFLATVEARNLGNATVLLNDAVVTLQSASPGGLRFYSNATCTTAITSTTIPGGQARASFYVKPITGGLGAVTATAPFGSANLSFGVQGLVRKGTCALSGLITTCPINPPQQSLSKTMLIYQAAASTNDPAESQVRCRLQTLDLISCQRSGGNITTQINWQTAELLDGLTVQRAFATTCPALPVSVPLLLPIVPSSAFVLSSFSGLGANYDGDDLTAARLTGLGSSLLIDNSSGQSCTGYEYQVVELAGVTTLRGGVPPPGLGIAQRQLVVPGLAPASPNTVLFHQVAQGAAPILSSTSMCNLMVRSELPSPTELRFSRGGDNPAANECSNVQLNDVAWERVDFGSRARVQTHTVTLSGGSLDVTVLAVDTTRTLVFSGGQQAGGQATGETAVDANNDDAIGPGMARFDLVDPTTVRVTRGRNQSTGTFTFYVVELEP